MKNTIKLNREFRRCYRGKSSVQGSLVVYAAKNSQNREKNRLGITVSKTIGCAVKRNRAKRLLRQAFFETVLNQVVGFDIIIVARTRINGKKTDLVKRDFISALKELGLWNDEKSIT